ncbi:MAG: peptide-methionine (S)-S-oxide reductase MsrA [Opitutaceae bacterium]|nr:peptide-methionine (S)-S-oxide reductase MsrA [Opitutaceae bacterium]
MNRLPILAVSLLLSMPAFSTSPLSAASPPTASTASEFAYLGGGCFWCTEAAYEMLPGVKDVVSGYAGGHDRNPSYREVCTGSTGHAEVVRIEFDPNVTSYRKIVDYFWNIHDPTTLNRQGADEGTQYRSIILTASDGQRAVARESMEAAQTAWGGKIVTEIVPLEKFYPAESYHQDYYRKHPNEGYCQVVIKPKINKLKKSPAVLGK